MEEVNETIYPKRKIEQIREEEPPDKRQCSDSSMEIESSKHTLNNNGDVPYLVKEDCTDKKEENGGNNDVNNHNTTGSNLVECSNFDTKDREQELEPCSRKDNSKELDSELQGDKSQEIESSKHVSNNNDAQHLVKEDCIDNTEKDEEYKEVHDNDTVDSNSVQCSNLDKENEQELKPCSEKESNQGLDLELKNDNSEEQGNSDTIPVQPNIDVSTATINNDTDNINQAVTTNPQSIPREKCKYGSQCYRRNTEHKAQFSHPGDADYDLPDDRPECPYGLDCYRKNPQHKLDYKHTGRRRRQAQTALNPGSPVIWSDWEDSMEESVDESDYDPSFIDDDSVEEFGSDFEDEDEK